MGRRYKFLDKESRFSAVNNLRNALLAAKNGEEVDKIINAIFTSDEKLKVGRRIDIAWLLKSGETFDNIKSILKVGKATVSRVEKQMVGSKEGFGLIFKRGEKVEKEFKDKAYVKKGPSMVL